MSEPFIGQIIMFGGNFAPRGWALCDGQLLPIAQYSALFSILGTTYGGDGRTTFALPDLRGRVPVHEGNGAGLDPISLGEKGGANTHTLTANQMPSHHHQFAIPCNNAEGNQDGPVNHYPASNENEALYNNAAGTNQTMAPMQTVNTGGSQPFNLMQPFLAVNFIIALVGTYPSRS
jgi:microcystin-dependent protein